MAVNPTPRKRGASRGKRNRSRHLEGCSERNRFWVYHGEYGYRGPMERERVLCEGDEPVSVPDNEDVVVETPDRSELPEWEDWSMLDEG